MKRKSLLIVFASVFILAVGVPTIMAIQAKGSGDALLLKPDIVIHSLTVAKTGETASGDHRVRVTVVLRNAARHNNCTGPFKVKCDWTADPTAGFDWLGEAGVAKLCHNIAWAVFRTETRHFDAVVPKTQFRKFRVTVDFLNQVEESNETNNVNNVGYTAR